jgi:hypothetical protein
MIKKRKEKLERKPKLLIIFNKKIKIIYLNKYLNKDNSGL